MPYREMELTQLCRQCKEPTETRCLRCGDPSCLLHRGDETSRCINCESEYLSVASKWTNRFSGVALTITVFSLLIMAAASVTFFRTVNFPVILNWILAAPFVAWGATALAPRLARRSFLARRKEAALTGPTTEVKQLKAPETKELEEPAA